MRKYVDKLNQEYAKKLIGLNKARIHVGGCSYMNLLAGEHSPSPNCVYTISKYTDCLKVRGYTDKMYVLE